mgnify:CR=1 FL=1
MANIQITQLPAAGTITGTEAVPIVQNGVTVQTTTGAIAASPAQTQTFLTVNQEPTLANSRYVGVGSGLTISDGGAQGLFQIGTTGALSSLINAGNGIMAKTGSTTLTPRTLQTSGQGVTITNGDGVSGDPTFALTGVAAAIAGLSGFGQLTMLGTGATIRQLVGATNEVTVSDGAGTSGNPTIAIASNPVLPGTGAMTVPKGTTAQRPIGTNGQLRYNEDDNSFEVYANGGWTAFGQGVNSFSAGGTGFTPATTSYGNIVLDGVLNAAHGGTGTLSYAIGDTLYASGATALSKLTIGTNGFVMTSNGSAPTWTNPSGLSVGTATNIAGGAANQIAYQSGAGATTFAIAPTIAGTILQWNGSAFVWTAVSGTGTVTSVDASGGTTGMTFSGGPITAAGTLTLAGTLITSNGGTGLTSYTAGDILYYSTGTALSKLSIGSNGYVLISNGSAPQYVAQSTLSVGSATTATTAANLSGGVANQIPYQTAPGVTSFVVAPAVADRYLKWDGSAFVWATAGTGSGTVTSIDVSGGLTGLTFTGGPVTSSGTITASGTLATGYGGTGQTTYTDGQLLIGNSATGSLSKATLIAGSNITITNGNGTITIDSTGGGSGSATQAQAYAWFIC